MKGTIEISLSAFDAFATSSHSQCLLWLLESSFCWQQGTGRLKPAGLQAGVGWNAALRSLNALLCLVPVAVFMPLLCLTRYPGPFLAPLPAVEPGGLGWSSAESRRGSG